MFTSRCNLTGRVSIVEALLPATSRPGTRDKSGSTALSRAAIGGSKAVVEILEAAGCNIDTRDRNGEL